MRIVWIFAAFLALASCSSQFVLSDAARSKARNLDEAAALDILRNQFRNSGEQAGICQVVTNALYNDSRLSKIEADGMLYATGVIKKIGSITPEAGSTIARPTFTVHPDYESVPVRLNLKTIFSIRVKDRRFVSEEQIDCPDKKGTIAIWIRARDYDYAGAVIIKVAEKNLDETLAALITLSPEAKLRAGIGF